MMNEYKPYAVVYRVNGRPEVEETFDTEKDMHDYYNIWIDYPDIDYLDFFEYDKQYTPSWVDE